MRVSLNYLKVILEIESIKAQFLVWSETEISSVSKYLARGHRGIGLDFWSWLRALAEQGVPHFASSLMTPPFCRHPGPSDYFFSPIADPRAVVILCNCTCEMLSL